MIDLIWRLIYVLGGFSVLAAAVFYAMLLTQPRYERDDLP